MGGISLFLGGGGGRKKIWEGGRKRVFGKDVPANSAQINNLTISNCQFLGSLFSSPF